MTYITAKEMHDAAKQKCACQEALDWLASLPPNSNPLDHEHSRKAAWACWYARNIIKGRWFEAEETIATSPGWAYFYARDVIKDRWPEVETLMASSPEWAYFYARDVIKGLWIEAEETISADSRFWSRYKESFNLS